MPWLITWEASDPALLPQKRIACVLDGRSGVPKVNAVLEALYASHRYSETELVLYCSISGRNPYPAQADDIEGIRYQGQMTCGHNPWLRARRVSKLRVADDGRVTWQERPKPNPPR